MMALLDPGLGMLREMKCDCKERVRMWEGRMGARFTLHLDHYLEKGRK